MKKELSTRTDIELLITLFYEKVRRDPLLSPVFLHVDWEHHTPVIVNFWTSLLLGDMSYQGNPFQKHIGLPIQQQHFEQWLMLFTQTLEENFTGEKAIEARDRAHSIADMFKYKLGLTK
jgi:hemoglobin